MPQLIDLDLLGTTHEWGSLDADDDAHLDALARDLAGLVCPAAELLVWPQVAMPLETTDLSLAGRHKLPDAYSLPADGCLEADLGRLIADLETQVRRARRGRWINQVMALPA